MEINVVETTRAVPFSWLYAGDIFRFVTSVTDFEPGIWMKTSHCDDDYHGDVIVNLDTGFTDVVKFEEARKILVEKAKSTSMTVEFQNKPGEIRALFFCFRTFCIVQYDDRSIDIERKAFIFQYAAKHIDIKHEALIF